MNVIEPNDKPRSSVAVSGGHVIILPDHAKLLLRFPILPQLADFTGPTGYLPSWLDEDLGPYRIRRKALVQSIDLLKRIICMVHRR